MRWTRRCAGKSRHLLRDFCRPPIPTGRNGPAKGLAIRTLRLVSRDSRCRAVTTRRSGCSALKMVVAAPTPSANVLTGIGVTRKVAN
jgi:hypothetical protein